MNYFKTRSLTETRSVVLVKNITIILSKLNLKVAESIPWYEDFIRLIREQKYRKI